MSGRLHDARLAGRWYPAERAPLQQLVDGLLDASPVDAAPPPTALVVPHAGYAYSGRGAASAYATLRHAGASYQRVVVLAPSHYAGFRGAMVLGWDGFTTPLGEVPIDRAAVAALRRAPLYGDDAAPFGPEHALEIQLPFLQRTLPGTPILPILIGHLRGGDAALMAAGLHAIQTSGTLFVVSSDFTHYGARFDYLPFPASDAAAVRTQLRRLDLGAVEAVCAGDSERFHDYVVETGATICGRGPIEVFLSLNRRRQSGDLLAYYTSLDVTGDFEHCVSYASIRFAGPRPAG